MKKLLFISNYKLIYNVLTMLVLVRIPFGYSSLTVTIKELLSILKFG